MKVSLLLTCLERQEGMTATAKDGRAEIGGIVDIHGDRARVEKRLAKCNRDWSDYLRHR